MLHGWHWATNKQWGYIPSIKGGDTLTFPIAMSNTNYSITGSSYDSLSIYCAKFTDRTTDKCKFKNGIGHVSYDGSSDLNWFLIGI